ncbi:hypothetical protein D3C78_1901000 [compost metagenome]
MTSGSTPHWALLDSSALFLPVKLLQPTMSVAATARLRLRMACILCTPVEIFMFSARTAGCN